MHRPCFNGSVTNHKTNHKMNDYINTELNTLKPTLYNYRLKISDGKGNQTKTIQINEAKLTEIKALLTKTHTN